MKDYILKGCFLQSDGPNKLQITKNGFLPVTDGLCRGIFPELPAQYLGLPVTDYGDKLILPGMTDLHVHASQFALRGIGMDLELLDWLNRYTFPEESKFSDPAYAEQIYAGFVDELLHSATTRAAVFATVHPAATLTLMRLLERSGLRTCVGKVSMDRNCPDSLRESDPALALQRTEQWIQQAEQQFVHTKPILTPRFIPACSDQLLSGLRTLQRRYALPVQSHLSENLGEIEWVKQLSPAAGSYAEAYARFGLLGGNHPCIMAHCVHSEEAELELLHRNGVFIAHSPESNMNLASGVAPVSRYLALGLRVGLATDLAAGSNLSMLQAMMHAIQVSKLRWRLQDDSVRPLTLEQAFYLATAGGGAFFGKVGQFSDGFAFDAVVLDDSRPAQPQALDPRSRLERAVYLADARCVFAKYVAGEQLF